MEIVLFSLSSQPSIELRPSLFLFVPVKPEEKKLSIVRTSNAVCPLVWRDFVCYIIF